MTDQVGGWGERPAFGRGHRGHRFGRGECRHHAPEQGGEGRGHGGHHRRHGMGGHHGMGPESDPMGFGPGGMGPMGFGPGMGHGGPGFMGRFAMPAAFFGRGPAVRRGDVRSALLSLLRDDGPMHGYQAIQELTKRSGGAWRPSAGSIYPTLQQLEDEGLVASEERDGRRVYRLTEAGAAAAGELTGGEPWASAGSSREAASGPATLRPIVFQLGAAVMQVAQIGSPETIDATRKILETARRDIYRLLAEDPTENPAAEPEGPNQAR